MLCGHAHQTHIEAILIVDLYHSFWSFGQTHIIDFFLFIHCHTEQALEQI